MVKRRVELAPRRSAPAQPEDAADRPAGGEAVDAPMPAQKRAKFSIHDLLLNHEAKDEPPTLVAAPLLPYCASTSSPTTLHSTNSADEDELRTASGTPESTAGGVDPPNSAGGDLGAQLAVNWTAAGDSAALAGVRCVLESRELWSKFHKLSTEMIITKSGRRMFPTVKARLEGCDPDALYYVFLDVIPVDAKRYRYVYNKSAWLTAGKAEPSPRCRVYMHPDSPFSGRQLASQVISFEKAKLTNNEVDRTGHLVLNSMHKYQPRVHVVRRERHSKPLDGNAVDFNLLGEEYRTFHFAETQFMAVTAYQNQLITKLKIEKNPFAKGFRDPTGRGNDLGDLSRQLENLPRQMFEHPAAAALFLSQCAWPPPPLSAAAGLPPAAAMSSLFDSTNLPKLLANFPPLPFALPPLLLPPNSTAASSPSSFAKPNGAPLQSAPLPPAFFSFPFLPNGANPAALLDPAVTAALCSAQSTVGASISLVEANDEEESKAAGRTLPPASSGYSPAAADDIRTDRPATPKLLEVDRDSH